MREQQLGLKVDGDCADEAFTVVVDDVMAHYIWTVVQKNILLHTNYNACINVFVYNGIIHGKPVMDNGKHIVSTCI